MNVSRSRVSQRHASPTFWTIEDIQYECQIAKATAWRLVRGAGFPPPVRLGSKTLRWPRVEVLAFLDAQRDEDHYRRQQTTVVAVDAPFVSRSVRAR